MVTTACRASQSKSFGTLLCLCLANALLPIIVSGGRSGGRTKDPDKRRKISIPQHLPSNEKKALRRVKKLLQECDKEDRNFDKLLIDWDPPSYYYNQEYEISYCTDNHRGSSYWNNVFNVLGSKTGVMDMKRLKRKNRGIQTDYLEPFGTKRLNQSKAFLMVRNPFDRLLSGFVQKLLVGGDVCQRIDFQQFLDSVISGVKLRMNLGLVFTPVVPLCRPCNMHVHAVIRHEHLADDVEVAFKGTELSKVKIKAIAELPQSAAPEKRAEDFLTEASTAFRNKKCSNVTDLVVRVWEGLRLRGLIRTGETFPYTKLKTMKAEDLEEVRQLALGVVKEQLVDKQELERSRSEALSNVYGSVMEETVDYIQQLYEFEFTAFQYSTIP